MTRYNALTVRIMSSWKILAGLSLGVAALLTFRFNRQLRKQNHDLEDKLRTQSEQLQVRVPNPKPCPIFTFEFDVFASEQINKNTNETMKTMSFQLSCAIDRNNSEFCRLNSSGDDHPC